MQYNYDQVTDEFVENFTGKEEGFITGNRVFVSVDDNEGTFRFRVDIDDQGHVLGALNRLVKRLIPTFVFPKGV